MLTLSGLAGVAATPPALAGACKLGQFAEFPITMVDSQPLLVAKINDVDVHMLLDSGAFFSSISAASAAQLKLPTYPLPYGLEVRGVTTGAANMSLTRVKVFTLAGVPLEDIEFLVGGGEIGAQSVGLLGQNVLHLADIEFDLGHGIVRLMKAQDCSKTLLAYWVPNGSTYSVINIEADPPQAAEIGSHLVKKTTPLSHTIGTAYINGTPVRVMFDTGAATSILSLKAAARLGITAESLGVKYAGTTWGIGTKSVPTYVAPFASFKLGDEEIRNTRLRIADIDLSKVDMLVGADFFLSHRVYVANGQHKLYFTYNGGPVFNLSDAKYAATTPAPEAGTGTGTAAAPGSSLDAAEYARRGAAAASRRDFAQAMSDLGHACDLAPDHAEFFYQRGMVSWQMRQAAAALADFDKALALKADDVTVLVSRAELRLQAGDKSAAAADLDAADHAAPKQADLRLAMGHIYEGTGQIPAAITQYGLWIDAHADDARLPHALNSRCWARALTGSELGAALKDCDAALKRLDKSNPLYGRVLDSRGFVRLRMGDYDHSIADYDAAIAMNPKSPGSWYGRGIDKMHKHDSTGGQADIAQANSLSPTIADEFSRHGIDASL